MSTSILTRWRKAFTTDEDGNDALRTVISGDQNLGGGYITNEQTTTNMMSKGTVYRFDGSNDKVVVTSDTENDMTTNDFFVLARFRANSTGAIQYIVSKKQEGSGGKGYNLLLNDDGTIRALLDDDNVSVGWNTPLAYDDGKDHVAIVVYDRDGLGTTYIDGAPVATADISGANLTISTAKDLHFGVNSENGTSFPIDGTIAEVMIGNFIPTASEIKDLISGNLPYKWQYGSQTELIADVNDRTFAAASNWVNASMGSYSEATNAQVISSTGAGQAATLGVAFAPMVTGKAYRLLVTASGLSGDAFALRDEANAVLDSSQGVFTPVAGVNVYEFVYTGTTGGGFRLRAGGTGSITLDDYSLVEIGAVAHYTQDSISETYWYDKANGNDGAVTGSEVLNPPSVTPLSCLRTMLFTITPGATPNTNINVSTGGTTEFNPLSLSDATNLAKDGTSGSYSLNSAGNILSVTAGNVIGVMSAVITTHDINNSSTTEMYVPVPSLDSGNLRLLIRKRGATATVDWTSIIDAGDTCSILVTMVTAT